MIVRDPSSQRPRPRAAERPAGIIAGITTYDDGAVVIALSERTLELLLDEGVSLNKFLGVVQFDQLMHRRRTIDADVSAPLGFLKEPVDPMIETVQRKVTLRAHSLRRFQAKLGLFFRRPDQRRVGATGGHREG
ncbi:hypothetical protein [Oceaniglobus trochenteri]|uniref:hypothetical protein n=1 Tax=Oceaniglobus trochenteri TaxID=2763260 RepID=UPI001CFFD3AA|nr:hypothetical protein [Oceaniglobus trochenteri]